MGATRMICRQSPTNRVRRDDESRLHRLGTVAFIGQGERGLRDGVEQVESSLPIYGHIDRAGARWAKRRG